MNDLNHSNFRRMFNKFRNETSKNNLLLFILNSLKHVLLVIIILIIKPQVKAQTVPLEKAHAHNDYENSRPLLDALEHGFTSFEADIHFIEGELYVTHDHPQTLDKSKTLKTLYLEPLRLHIFQNNGKIYDSYEKPVYLLIDIKTEAKSTLAELQKQVQEYATILAHKQNPTGLIKIIISGNRDFEFLLTDHQGMICFDGRPSDLKKNFDSEQMPLISENYFNLISWHGEGEINSKEFKVLKDLTQEAHRQGKRFRLWATPENEKVWQVLLNAGVDLLNTDDLARLKAFLTVI